MLIKGCISNISVYCVFHPSVQRCTILDTTFGIRVEQGAQKGGGREAEWTLDRPNFSINRI